MKALWHKVFNDWKIPAAILVGFVVLGFILRGAVADRAQVVEQIAPHPSPLPYGERGIEMENRDSTEVASETPGISETQARPSAQKIEAVSAAPQLIPTPEAQEGSAKVTFVVDGDTVELENGQRVRLIGIDTPERGELYFSEAREKMIELVLNKTVRLEKDVSETDRYGRLLRYLYVGDTFVNLAMVRQGYAKSYSYPPDIKYQDQIVAAQSEARENQAGLWKPIAQTEQNLLPPTSTSGSYTLPPCASSDCDCKDFDTHDYAQWFHENYNAGDKHRLDRDGDGDACETLP